MTGARIRTPGATTAELTIAELRDYLEDFAADLDREGHDLEPGGHSTALVAAERGVVARILVAFDHIVRDSSTFPQIMLDDQVRDLARKREERAALGGRVTDSLARENHFGGAFAVLHITNCAERASARAARPRTATTRRRQRSTAPTQELDR